MKSLPSGVVTSRKALAATASIGSLFALQEAQAQIVHSTASFSAGLGSSLDVGWDIDGDANDDTRFSVFGGGSYLYFNAGFEGGFGFVSNANDLVALGSGFQVGAAMSPFDFNSGFITALYSGGFSDVRDFVSGSPSYIGFRFDRSGQTHYGWAEIVLSTGGSGGVTVNEWAWESTAGTAISVGATTSAVPEPSAAALGLGALALGAAGVRRRRRQQRPPAAAAEA